MLLPLAGFSQAHFRHLDLVELGRMKKVATEQAMKAPGVNGASIQNALRAPVTVLMRVSDDATVDRISAAGGEVSLRAGDIVIVETTIADAERLAAIEGVVTASLSKELTFNTFTSSIGYDTSRQWLGLDKMQAGEAPLPGVYAGQGVIVGVIDGGLDPNHIMFDDENGNPRVKRIINHVQVGSNRLTQRVETPEKVRQFKTDASGNTHGTHVLGLAAGSYKSEDDGVDFSSAAPKADIALKCGVTDNARLIQGLEYITNYAKEEGKPCVINISLGSNSGPHDGTDEFPAALQTYAAMDGVTICVSAGNEGADQAFLYHEFADDTTPMKTFIAPSAYTDYLYSQVAMLPMYPQAIGQLEIWSDDSTPFDVYFDLYNLSATAAPQLVNSFYIEPGKTAYMSSTGRSPVTGADVEKFDNEAFNANYRDSFVGGSSSIYPANNRFYSELNFQLECPDAATYQTGIMSLRVVPRKTGQKIYVYGLPMSAYFGFSLLSGQYEAQGFTGSYGNGSINAMAGAKDVITVGSYVSHNLNPTVAPQYTLGTTSSFSSWGQTPDGRVHPLISAPGTFIVSSMSPYYYNLLGEDDQKDERVTYYRTADKAGKEHYWTIMSGTSMSSPLMTGIAAAWLSADNSLTTADILDIAQTTATKPVKSSENDGAGCLVDAYAGLCKILNIAGVADVTIESQKAYTLTNDRGLVTVRMPAAASITAELYTMSGSRMMTVTAEGGEVTLDATSLASGIYVLSLRSGNAIYSEKIAIP